MADIIIKYTKKRLYINLILALFWTTLGVFVLWESNTIRWYNFGYLLAGLLYFTQFFYDLFWQYLFISDECIKINGFFGKKIRLKDITAIEKFAGGYTLKTENQKFNIHTNLIDENSLIEFDTFLNTIEISEKEYYELKI